MNPLPIELHPEAIDEASDARVWLSRRSPRAAEAFIKELDQAIEQICKSPERFARYLHGTRVYLLKRFPYLVVFRMQNEKIEVLAIAHGKRKPGYWHNRKM